MVCIIKRDTREDRNLFSHFFSDCDAPFQVNFYTDTSNDGTTSAQRGIELLK